MRIFSILMFAINTWAASPIPLNYPEISVRGQDEQSFKVQDPGKTAIKDPGIYDAVIVGGGLSGLTSALYLVNHSKKVLLLEKEQQLGGLAAGEKKENGIMFDRGAAYWTDAYEEEQKILNYIGFGKYKTKNPISEPADSFLWNGRLYRGIWEEKTLAELPASFALFKFALQQADRDKQIPNQPLEDPSNDLSLDQMTAAEWIRSMPYRVREIVNLEKSVSDPKIIHEAMDILARFNNDKSLPATDPMIGVIGLADLYCRSALGAETNFVSAVAFANFYISEIVTRYTTELGTGGVAEKILSSLGKSKTLEAKINSPVISITDMPDEDTVRVKYLSNGAVHNVIVKYVVYSGQMGFVPSLVNREVHEQGRIELKNLQSFDPLRASQLNAIKYAHYSVHNVFVKGHPYRETYDTWIREDATYSENEFTDVILGRWMDPKIRGYEGMRDFSKDPKDDDGIFTIYHALPADFLGKGYTVDESKTIAQAATQHMFEFLAPFLHTKDGTPVEVTSIITNRWPFSVHIAGKGHFSNIANIRKPVGHIYFANNNLGTPAFEEALFRGHCAADNVLKHLDKKFRYESWTKCPRE